MKRYPAYIILTTFILLISTVACGLFNRGDETVNSPTAENQSPDSISPDEPASGQGSEEQTPEDIFEEQSESTSSPYLDLGVEYRSDEGGYVFKPIPDYEFEEFYGLSTMISPDADPDLGPVLMLVGGLNDEEVTIDEIFNNFLEDAEREDVEISNRQEISVDGKTGLIADIAGGMDGQLVTGRIVVVAVSPNHQFTMFASAPRDRWSEIESSFMAVLESIYFFEPQEMDLFEDLENMPPDGDSLDESTILDISSLEEFPTEASQLPPGSFAYLLADDQGFPTIVAGGMVQTQSTGGEIVIAMVSTDQEYNLTLFIPLEVAPGILAMKIYDPSASTNDPGAAVDRDLTRYYNTDGIIMIDAVVDYSITGSVHFSAVDDFGNEIVVTGFFNELPMASR